MWTSSLSRVGSGRYIDVMIEKEEIVAVALVGGKKQLNFRNELLNNTVVGFWFWAMVEQVHIPGLEPWIFCMRTPPAPS